MRFEDSSHQSEDGDDSMPFPLVKSSEIITGIACRDLLPRQTRRVSRIHMLVFRYTSAFSYILLPDTLRLK